MRRVSAAAYFILEKRTIYFHSVEADSFQCR
jgi:hypothetical protein